MKIIYAINCDEIQVSDCDFLFLAGYNWSYNKNGYYICSNRGTLNSKRVNGRPIHWFVTQLMGLEISEGFQIDHIDRDKSNNQRSNLRAASRQLQKHNMHMRSDNTSGYTGVYFEPRSKINPWSTQIILSTGERKFLGCFKTPEEASEVYQAAKAIRDQKEIDRCQCL